MSTQRFDPNEFFQRAALYPSSARGQFTLNTLPEVLKDVDIFISNQGRNNNEFTVGERINASHIQLGITQLQQGLTAYTGTVAPQTMATSDNFSYTGPGRKMPYNISYSDLEISFYLMGKTLEEAGSLYRTLTFWQEQIAGYRKRNSTATYTNAPKGSYTSTFFSIEYYENFVGEAELNIYHQSNPTVPVNKWRYYELYPIAIGAMPYDWGNQDQPMVLPVTFTYHYVNAID